MQIVARTRIFVAATLTAAAVLSLWIYRSDPTFRSEFLIAALSFSAVATLSSALSYERAVTGARGSAAFLPYLVIVVLAPHWTGLLGAGVGVLVAELIVRRPLVKLVFNVGQTVGSVAVAIIMYRGFGGASPLSGAPIHVTALAAALPTHLLINNAATAGVIAISTRQRFRSVLAGHAHTAVYDLLALPFVYVFAWLYVQFGAFAAGMLAVPLLGIRELYKTNNQLQQTNRELLELMVAAIEARDPYTSGHSRRVAANSRLIAEFLGLPRKQIERIFVAALLHDVGKIHEVFGPILSKPGRLTPAEHDIMQTHAAKGAELVQNVSQLRDIVPVVLHHHENWDGSGYPDGVSREHIPIGARVIMFADTIDAMMSDRPYRPAMTAFQVRAELIRMRGKQFDPAICDALLASHIWDELFANAPTPVRTGEHPMLVPRATRVPA